MSTFVKSALVSSLCRDLMVVAVAAGIALPGQLAIAQVPDRTPVTDPNVLRSMGFAPDAANVYMDDLVGRATVSDADIDAVVPATTPTTGTDFSAISAKEFIGRIDETGNQWRYTGGPLPSSNIDLSRVGSEVFAEAQFEVPTGATLDFFRFWAFDNSLGNFLSFFVLEICQPGFAAGPPEITVIVSTSTSGTPGDTTGVVGPLNRAVNNRDCTYLTRVRFGEASRDLALNKVRLQFTR